ncbi:hypothetical protein [Streptomyces antnestii]|uniref:hypothetical protein n=1 Tax=Streptomyces antnestii TaxID=2494256 RepID=UPI001672ED0A|nr:hypothetical protein [Streptomyces sp. San01]
MTRPSPTPGTGATGGATAGEPSPGATSASGGAHSGDEPGDEPGDGDLASTGAGAAMWCAALAVLLVGGGVAVRAVVRRRRA